jgi:hypothetical protein
MTSPTCHGRGGDFAIWATSVIDDTPSLLAYFQASMFGQGLTGEDKARADETIASYQTVAQQVPTMMPTGAYCVNDLMQWAGVDPSVKPFGFPWGLDNNHQTGFYCVDLTDPNADPSTEYNKYFGAERAPCTGFYISCDGASGVEKTQCAAWDTFSDEYVKRVTELRDQAINDHPSTGKAPVITVPKSPGQIASDIAGGWFTSLTTAIAQGAATLLADSMSWWTTTDHSALLQNPAITQIQAMLRYVGLALLAGSIIWQGIMMMYRRKLDPLVSTGMGLLSFVGWSTLGGTAAILINQAGIALADQVLSHSIDGFANSVTGTLIGLAGVQTGAVFFLAIILFLLSCVQWVLGFFRMGALVILLALIPTAAAGRVNESTKPWLPTVASWSLTLELYQPASAIAYAIGFTLIGKGGSLSTVLVGMAVVALAVISMPAMLRFFNWGGQKLVNSGGGGGGGAMAAGAAASALGGGGAAGFGRFMEHNGPASGAGGRDSGAMPVSSAHAGDGPGDSPSNSSSGHGIPGPGSVAPGVAGDPTGTGPGVSSAAAGAGQPAGGTAGGGAAGAGAARGASAGGTGGAAGGAAAAGPAGAAVAGAQAAKEGIDKGVAAVAGAMTDGGPSGAST